MKKIWTVLSLILAGAALFPVVRHAGIVMTNHNETLVRDTPTQ